VDTHVVAAGMLFMGADALGDLSYTLEPMWDWHVHHPILGISAQSLFAAPLVLGATWDDTYGRMAAVTADLPFFLRLSPGLQILEAGVQGAVIVPPSGVVNKTFDILKMIPWSKGLEHVPEIAYKHHESLDLETFRLSGARCNLS
jgi:hypothetical protein